MDVSEITKMTEAQAKNILRNREKWQKQISRKLLSLQKELQQLENSSDEYIHAAAFPRIWSADRIGDRGDTDTDNLYVIEKYRDMQDRRGREIRLLMSKLQGKLDCINRLWLCFMALPERYYEILDRLYNQRELYKSVEADVGYTHHQFENKRKEGMAMLVDMYNSSRSNMELIEKGL